MVSSFNRLPLEVLTIILGYAPDLPTIYKFICASSHANAAFTIDSPQILDAAIERSIPEFKHSARMIAILGTLASKPDLSFKGLVDSYKDLPTEVLSTAPASYAFVKDTPGPRYLVLTAYRIEVLQYICFVSLLQNIHEVNGLSRLMMDRRQFIILLSSLGLVSNSRLRPGGLRPGLRRRGSCAHIGIYLFIGIFRPSVQT